MPDQDDLDRLIDKALASYADPGPNSGLERRVLAYVSTTFARRRRRLTWAAVLPAAAIACILLLFLSTASRHAQLHPPPESVAPVEKSMTAAPVAHTTPPRASVRSAVQTRKTAHSAPRAAALPKLDTFPSPAPLSSEEKALVGLVAQTSAAQREDLAAWRLRIAEPIHIAAISIPSVNPPAEGKE